ncbi:MAG: hypothetical protein P8N51_15415, partial [Pseudomonadales bacterium]|nr:hypothetical protein [Pseudomonadales bacterium]
MESITIKILSQTFIQNNTLRFRPLLVLLLSVAFLQGCQNANQSITVNDIERTYITSVANLEATSATISDPISESNKSPVDTVLLLHDYNSNGTSFFETTRISASIAKRPIRVIAPDALGAVFNDGSGLFTDADDVALLNALLDQYHDKDGKVVILGI